MKMRRRNFIKASLAAGTAFAVPSLLNGVEAAAEAAARPLPWQREIPLREAAQRVNLESTLDSHNPLPDSGGFGVDGGMTINNLKMRTTMWGSPDRVTVSLNKNNVWDRRINPRTMWPPTLQEVIDGAMSPANKDYVGRQATSLRPKEYGYLLAHGGTYDGYRQPFEYPFPCMKPVGQIILGMDPMWVPRGGC